MENVDGLGIHLSFQILVDLPLPIFQYRPFLRRLKDDLMLLHRKIGLDPSFASRMLPFLKYLCFRIWKTRESGCLSNLYSCLASITLLKPYISLNPKPPLDFGPPRYSHFFFL